MIMAFLLIYYISGVLGSLYFLYEWWNTPRYLSIGNILFCFLLGFVYPLGVVWVLLCFLAYYTFKFLAKILKYRIIED